MIEKKSFIVDMGKAIKITRTELSNIIKESIKTILNESTKIAEYEYNGHILSIRNYSLDNKDDMDYIRSMKNDIWEILNNGYESLGGFKGFQSIRDMLSKSPLYRLGYCDNELVTVTVYTGYLGGTKCVGATCVKDNRHDAAVKILEYIIKYNITDWDNWIWIEASGKIEEMCKKSEAFNVPTKFAEIYLNMIPFTPIDDFHYMRKIHGADEIKTIFGFKDRESFEIIKNEMDDKINTFLDKFNLNEEKSLFTKYISKKHPVYRYKSIVDYFVYLMDDEQYYEFTEQSMDILKNAVHEMIKYLDDKELSEKEKYYLNLTVEEGRRVLTTASIIEPITIPLVTH